MIRRMLRTAGILLGLAFLGVVALAAWSFYAQSHGLALSPEEAFEIFVQRPRPEAISDLQAAVNSGMQGYVAYLRFRTSTPALRFEEAGWQPVACDRIELHLRLPERLAPRFAPPWAPRAASGARCLRIDRVRNAWAESAMQLVMLSDDWVYFKSEGD